MNMQYIIFNKPYGVLSQFTDEGTGHATLKPYINIPDVYAAGRLDRDSEGLLLLTDDGTLIKRLTDPKHHIEKTYWVMIEGEPTSDKLTQLERGFNSKTIGLCPASPPHSDAEPATAPQACHSACGHRVDRDQAAGRQETPDPPYDRGGWFANLAADPCSHWTYSFGESGTWPMARPDDEGSGSAKKPSGAKPKNQKALVQHTVTPESREQVVWIFLGKRWVIPVACKASVISLFLNSITKQGAVPC